MELGSELELESELELGLEVRVRVRVERASSDAPPFWHAVIVVEYEMTEEATDGR